MAADPGCICRNLRSPKPHPHYYTFTSVICGETEAQRDQAICPNSLSYFLSPDNDMRSYQPECRICDLTTKQRCIRIHFIPGSPPLPAANTSPKSSFNWEISKAALGPGWKKRLSRDTPKISAGYPRVFQGRAGAAHHYRSPCHGGY